MPLDLYRLFVIKPFSFISSNFISGALLSNHKKKHYYSNS
jgi:hypothetical protein